MHIQFRGKTLIGAERVPQPQFEVRIRQDSTYAIATIGFNTTHVRLSTLVPVENNVATFMRPDEIDDYILGTPAPEHGLPPIVWLRNVLAHHDDSAAPRAQ